MKGKTIYETKGKAAEYAKYGVSFFTGCSNMCDYCYLRKGRFAKVLDNNIISLKKCFKGELHALKVFEKELKANLTELQKHGLFFSFTSDPMLFNRNSYTNPLNLCAIHKSVFYSVPVKILTKRADFFDNAWGYAIRNCTEKFKKYVAFGFSLTGRDDLEPFSSTNAERIEAMRKLHDAGFKTFASIEPIIDFVSSAEMIRQTIDYCDLYKIGLNKYQKYDMWEIQQFINYVCNKEDKIGRVKKIYFKDGYLDKAGVDREDLPANCVDRDYNMFNS